MVKIGYLKDSIPNEPMPDDLIDTNIRIDYTKLRHLLLVNQRVSAGARPALPPGRNGDGGGGVRKRSYWRRSGPSCYSASLPTGPNKTHRGGPNTEFLTPPGAGRGTRSPPSRCYAEMPAADPGARQRHQYLCTVIMTGSDGRGVPALAFKVWYCRATGKAESATERPAASSTTPVTSSANMVLPRSTRAAASDDLPMPEGPAKSTAPACVSMALA